MHFTQRINTINRIVFLNKELLFLVPIHCFSNSDDSSLNNITLDLLSFFKIKDTKFDSLYLSNTRNRCPDENHTLYHSS